MSLGISIWGVPFGFQGAPQLSFLLDSIDGAITAYSVTKKLSGSATKAFRLVRVSDLVETDIGFNSGVVDQGAVNTFLGASSGSIKTIYNQVADSNHLAETTQSNQPTYSNVGAVFDGVNDKLFDPNLIYNFPISMFIKMRNISYDANQNAGLNNMVSSGITDGFIFRLHAANIAFGYAANYFVNNYPIIQGEDFIFSALLSSGGSSTYKNGTLIESSSVILADFQGLGFGCRPGDIRFSNMLLDTAIVFSGLKNSSRSTIESALS